MKSTWAADDSRLVLLFEDRQEAADFHEKAGSEKGFLVPLPDELKLYSTIPVELHLDGAASLRFEAEVVQAFPLSDSIWNTAFLVDRLPAWRAIEEDAGNEGEVRGRAPIYRIQGLNPNQKVRLAMRAGKQERQVLLRDTSPMVLQALLVNPRIEAKEILRIVKSTHASAGILKRVAEDARWGKNLEVLSSVARNPKTPPQLAIRLIDRLRTSDLRMMGKMSSGLREDLRRAALKEYLRRSKR